MGKKNFLYIETDELEDIDLYEELDALDPDDKLIADIEKSIKKGESINGD
jgi:hypothetical protein